MDLKRSFQYTIRANTYVVPHLKVGLYIVSTPIGNMDDISLRALETLAGSTVIACEDTRTSGILLNYYGINRPKISYNEHNAHIRGPHLIRHILEGHSVALISDAGTPLISDPGNRLVNEAISANLKVIPIPGAASPIAALIASGLENRSFRFLGFLPNKKSKMMIKLTSLVNEPDTLIFFESPKRLVKTLERLSQIMGGRRTAVVARELTKVHETFHRGSLSKLIQEFDDMERIRGEIIILVEGYKRLMTKESNDKKNIDIESLIRESLKIMKPSQAASDIARKTGLNRSELYAIAMTVKTVK
ncbi:16S rRNA (cytidine(1402)-2'-O)-methyltransferase [Candidatus Endowatersipora endosymbiont of Watersipora subatra]|uniref:16S rRNA (cytidine(1402)-2'-O)-methyltransferase n=1 Tax=Candidatus Endowatersipora endosymbiont of Watersipora subatra TaxID=3077946 RepID=UPI00312C850F